VEKMCYLGPTTAAIVTTFMWKGKKTLHLFWLMLMFYGSALFGVIDHLWNGELFLVSGNWAKDALLGLVITAGIILAWRGIITLAKRTPSLNSLLEPRS
jgi:hypothetical protein